MRSTPFPTGVCVFRAESRASGVIITVRANLDIERPCCETVEVLTEAEDAIGSLRVFLQRFQAAADTG